MSSPAPQMSIPFYKAEIGETEIDGVVNCLKSGWLTSGPKVLEFEERFAEMTGAKHAVAVNSATAGLHLALEAVGVGRGDEVLVPTMTFAATSEVVIHLGGTPVLVDCRAGDLNICLKDMARKVTSKTKAIMPVHFAGQPCEMDEISKFADERDLMVIEDSAHAFPAKYCGRNIGTISELTCFSFYANKTITTGEGGMITTNNENLANRVRMMSLHGLSRGAWNRFSKHGKWRYDVLEAGYKYNLTDIAAAIGIGQLDRAIEFKELREKLAKRYQQAFATIDEVEFLDSHSYNEHAWHLFVVKLQPAKLTIDRDQFIEFLNSAGVSTSVHYTPLHLHSLYRERFGYTAESMPIATAVFEQIISLPLFPSMTLEQQDYVISQVGRIAAEHSK